MAKRDKICDEDIIRDSQAASQTPNLAFSVRLLAIDKRQTISVEMQNFTFQEKCVDGELRYVGFRDAEQMQGDRVCGNKSAVNVGHNNGIDRAGQQLPQNILFCAPRFLK